MKNWKVLIEQLQEFNPELFMVIKGTEQLIMIIFMILKLKLR